MELQDLGKVWSQMRSMTYWMTMKGKHHGIQNNMKQKE